MGAQASATTAAAVRVKRAPTAAAARAAGKTPAIPRRQQCNRGARQSTAAESEVRSNSSSRQSNRNEAVNSRQSGRNDRVDTRQSNRTERLDNRSGARRKAVNNWDRYGRGWYSSNGWYNNRPWNSGWYGGSYWNNWGWYPGQAAAWGLASMATFGVINSLVNSAQSNEVSYIVVARVLALLPQRDGHR